MLAGRQDCLHEAVYCRRRHESSCWSQMGGGEQNCLSLCYWYDLVKMETQCEKRDVLPVVRRICDGYVRTRSSSPVFERKLFEG